MDKCFASVTVGRSGLGKIYAIVGTMGLGRKELKSKSIGNRGEKPIYFLYAQDESFMLFSYSDKKRSGKKNVMVMTNMHDSVRVTRNER